MPSPQNHRFSRRGVLRSTTATATTALIQGLSPLGTFRSAVADERDDLGIGVIGCRYQGSVIAGLAKSHGRLLAMADVDTSIRDLSAIDPSVEKQTRLSPELIYEGVELSDGFVNRHFPLTKLARNSMVHAIKRFHKTRRPQKLIGVRHIVSAAATGNEVG